MYVHYLASIVCGRQPLFLHGKFPFNTNNFLNTFYSITSWCCSFQSV